MIGYKIWHEENERGGGDWVRNIQTRILEDEMDFANLTEKAQHDKLVALVDSMLELQKKYHEAGMERDKELF